MDHYKYALNRVVTQIQYVLDHFILLACERSVFWYEDGGGIISHAN